MLTKRMTRAFKADNCIKCKNCNKRALVKGSAHCNLKEVSINNGRCEQLESK